MGLYDWIGSILHCTGGEWSCLGNGFLYIKDENMIYDRRS